MPINQQLKFSEIEWKLEVASELKRLKPVKEDSVWSYKDLARRFGKSTQTILTWLRDYPRFKPGKSVLFTESTVQKMLNDKKQKLLTPAHEEKFHTNKKATSPAHSPKRRAAPA